MSVKDKVKLMVPKVRELTQEIHAGRRPSTTDAILLQVLETLEKIEENTRKK